MSDLIGKYDIGGVLDRFKKRYGIKYFKSDRYQGRLEDYMDQDDPDRDVMIAFRDELENGDRQWLQSEQFERDLMAAMYEQQSIDALSNAMGLDYEQMGKYFRANKVMNYHRCRMQAKAKQVVIVRRNAPLVYAATDVDAARRLGQSLDRVRNVLSNRHRPPRLIDGTLIKRRLWYEADGGFN